jgi:tetratricopeptide (TPR) repeat protein
MHYLILTSIVAGSLVLLVIFWLIFGRGPRLRRALRRLEVLLDEGHWDEALQQIEPLQRFSGLSLQSEATPPNAGTQRLRRLAARGHRAAADAELKEKKYEEALQHALRAAQLQNHPEAEARAIVVDAMLAEVRRLFAAGTTSAHTDAVLSLLLRVMNVQSPCPEATFWQALGLIRQNLLEEALGLLQQVQDQMGKSMIDPAFYAGGVLHRLGRSQEAIRALAEANRVDAGCPFVTWQMGISLVASGGDSGLAVRALQRALGPRGLPHWSATPERAWVEGFPEGKSYVHRLAKRYPYVCPLLGSDFNVILRQGQLALAQAYYRLGAFPEAAELYGKLLEDSPPTLVLLRGLGLSLARQGKYDQAFKHLRAAFELEKAKDALTAGYLALCGALGKPTNPEDKPKNVAFAVRLLNRYQMAGDPEWAGLCSAVLAEARAVQLSLGEEEQVGLCNALASVNATDPQAAAAYSQLAATFPQSVAPRHAWLYCQAAATHRCRGPRDLELFALAFRDPAAARTFFERQEWPFDDVLYTYLDRTARQAPGRFPEVLGRDFAAQGEAFLLERSRSEEEAGRKDTALAAVEVLLQLSPRCLTAYDRLACLAYRQGDLSRAVGLLDGWRKLAPRDHWPLVRQAIIEQERGNAERRAEAIHSALGLTTGPLRASIAWLGARLALRESVKCWDRDRTAPPPETLTAPLQLLQECLRDDPYHVEALWCLAAVHSALGNRDELKEQAAWMNRPTVTEARFHYLGAVCHLAKEDYPRVLELGQRAAADDSLEAESHYVMALAHLQMRNPTAAAQALQKVAVNDKTPSAGFARALLGRLSFERQAYDDAIKWWNLIDAGRRAEWKLDEPLRQTVLLAGLIALEKGKYELAGDRFREAGKLGLRDKRLGSLLTLALVKAGQKLMFGEAKK